MFSNNDCVISFVTSERAAGRVSAVVGAHTRSTGRAARRRVARVRRAVRHGFSRGVRRRLSCDVGGRAHASPDGCGAVGVGHWTALGHRPLERLVNVVLCVFVCEPIFVRLDVLLRHASRHLLVEPPDVVEDAVWLAPLPPAPLMRRRNPARLIELQSRPLFVLRAEERREWRPVRRLVALVPRTLLVLDGTWFKSVVVSWPWQNDPTGNRSDSLASAAASQ